MEEGGRREQTDKPAEVYFHCLVNILPPPEKSTHHYVHILKTLVSPSCALMTYAGAFMGGSWEKSEFGAWEKGKE